MMYYLMLLLCIGAAHAKTLHNEEIFLQANQHYHAQEYRQALGLYQSVPHKGAAVLQNMGNCWLQIGNQLQALICWKKALLQDPASAALQKNIDVVETAMGIKAEQTAMDELYAILHKIPLLPVQLLFLLLLYLLLGALYFGLVRTYVVHISLLSLLLGCVGVILSLKVYQSQKKYGIIVKNSKVTAGTHIDFSQSGVVKKGHTVVVSKREPGWCKIVFGDTQGWILDDCIERIN